MADHDDEDDGGVTYCRDSKFDIQLAAALIKERNLGGIFKNAKIELFSPKLELKSETYQWEQTGNICIEYRQDGKPSGLSITDADYWVHELRRANDTLVYLMFPIERLKALCREAIRAGRARDNAGDGGRFSVVILPLEEILK